MVTEDKILPQAPELERAIIGAALIEQGIFEEVYSILDNSEYFYDSNHQKIFNAMLSLFQTNTKITAFTVMDELKKQKQFVAIGGEIAIMELTKQSTAISLQEHCLILKQKAAKRLAIEAAQLQIEQAFDDSVDIDDILTQAQDAIDRIEGGFNGSSLFRPFSYFVNEACEAMHRRILQYQEGKSAGIPTPITDLTKALTGWLGGDLIVVAGRPSMGKTAFALVSIMLAARQGVKVNMFSMEMKGRRLADRLLCGEAGVDHERYRAGVLSEAEAQKIEQAGSHLSKLHIYIDDYAMPTIDYIRSRARINKRQDRCEMIVIDYLQLLDSPYIKGQNREREVATLSRKAKSLAMDLDVPVLLISQLNRACELRADKRPQLADLRESGAIEQDADTVLLLYRPQRYEIYEQDGQSTIGRGEIIVEKQRDGRTGTIYFGYNTEMTKIFDYESEGQI